MACALMKSCHIGTRSYEINYRTYYALLDSSYHTRKHFNSLQSSTFWEQLANVTVMLISLLILTFENDD